MKDYLINASVRLLCNYADLPFNTDKNEAAARTVTERVSAALERSGDNYAYLLPDGLHEGIKRDICDKRLIHPDTDAAKFSVLYLRMDGKACIQTAVCDHAAVSVFSETGDLHECLGIARHIRHQLTASGTIARDADYGYLTTHPCDAGTGMRAALLLHLPMLQLTKQFDKMIRLMSASGASLRPASNDLSNMTGSLYLLENRAALGKSVTDMANLLLENAEKALDIEKKCRHAAIDTRDEGIYDAVWRAYGIARYARRLTGTDALGLWSHLTLGVSIGAFELESNILDSLWEVAHDQVEALKASTLTHPDIIRAQFVRSLFNGGN